MSEAHPWPEQFEQALRESLGGRIPPEVELAEDSDLRLLGLDSLATMGMLLRVEELFGIEFDDAELVPSTFATPGALWAAISSKDGLHDTE